MTWGIFEWLMLLSFNIFVGVLAAFLLTVDPTQILVDKVLILIMILCVVNVVWMSVRRE